MPENLEEFMSSLDADSRIDVDAMSEDELSEVFSLLDSQMSAVYTFVLNYNEYMNARHTYGDDLSVTMLEAHLLTDICDLPDSTVTGLARKWNRSVSATSQTVGKLIKKGLVVRESAKAVVDEHAVSGELGGVEDAGHDVSLSWTYGLTRSCQLYFF